MVKGSNNEVKYKNNPFWDKEGKKPTKFTFILLIAITASFLIWGILDTIDDFHEIKIVVDCDEDYYGSVVYENEYNSIDRGSGLREFSYEVREGLTITITFRRTTNDLGSNPLYLKLYYNGNLVLNITEYADQRQTVLEYTID
jgi:hypothetical protein